MANWKFIKGHTLYAYFAGDVVSDQDLGGAENAKKLEALGHVIPDTESQGAETPEDKLTPAGLEVRTGAEASPAPGENLPATEGQVVANVSDAERLGIDDKPLVSPEIDRNLSPGKPAKK